eukprot:scaffold76066_cov18-Tisochrysis_lutea.AAC.1
MIGGVNWKGEASANHELQESPRAQRSNLYANFKVQGHHPVNFFKALGAYLYHGCCQRSGGGDEQVGPIRHGSKHIFWAQCLGRGRGVQQQRGHLHQDAPGLRRCETEARGCCKDTHQYALHSVSKIRGLALHLGQRVLRVCAVSQWSSTCAHCCLSTSQV